MTRAFHAVSLWVNAARCGLLLLLLAFFAGPARAETSQAGSSPARDAVVGRETGPSVGLLFHSGIPTNMRKLMVEDLLWLGKQPNFRNSTDFAAVLGYPGEVLDGKRLVAWFLQRVRFVARSDFCPFQSLVIVDDHRPAWLRFSTLNVRCNPPDGVMALMYGGDRWRRAASTGKEVDGAYVDQRVLLHPRTSGGDFPGMFLNLENLARIGFSDDEQAKGLPQRVYRLIPLLHGSRHFDSFSHTSCGGQYLGTHAIRFTVMTTGSDRKGIPVCDESTWGPQGLTGAFAMLMGENCVGCSPEDVKEIHYIAADQYRRVAVPLKRPWRLGELAAKTGAGTIPRDMVDVVADAVPHFLFFKNLKLAAEARMGPCGGRNAPKICPSIGAMVAQVDAVIAMFSAAERSGEFAGSWSGLTATKPVTPPDLAGASEWLTLVERAADRGYNVPAGWLMSCAELAIGCPTREQIDFTALQSEREPPIVIDGIE